MLVAVVWIKHSLVATCVSVIMQSTSTKPDSRVAVSQWLPFSPRKPILALPKSLPKCCWSLLALNPSLLQPICKEALEPISDFHLSRPSEVLRYSPSAIREYKEFACWLMTINLICWPIFIPRQILEKDVFQ